MNGELLALGVSHKTAPLELRERLALTEGRAAAVLADLTAREEIHEAVAISTCNRTELYLVASDAVAAESAALSVLAAQANTRPTELTDSLYSLRDLDVANHLFSVAAGLDSMIVGEAEIQGQVKRAYELALVEGMTGPISNRLFRAALAAGKHVRSETGVGRSRVSVASVAAELATHGLDATSAGAGRSGGRCPAAPEDAGTSGEPAHFDAASLARAAVASVDAAAHADGASSGGSAQDNRQRPATEPGETAGNGTTERPATERSGASRTGATEGPTEEDGASASIGDDQERPAGDLSDRRVLVIGAGEQGERTAQALNDRGAHAVFVANRHYDRAIGLAQRYSGSAVPLDELPGELCAADIVVSCTSSPHQLVGREELELVLAERDGRPLVIIDTAVPRDVDPGVRELPSVTLYDMDDLQREVARNLSVREAEAERARELVDRDVQELRAWLAGLDVLPTIRGLRERADAIVEQVLEENAPRWESLSTGDHDRLRAMARALVARLFHEPTMRLKAGAEDEASYAHVAALRELFGLDSTAPEPTLDDEADQPTAEITELDSRRRRG